VACIRTPEVKKFIFRELLNCELISKIGKFADDTKMSKSVNNIADMKELQDDLNKLEDWSKDCQSR